MPKVIGTMHQIRILAWRLVDVDMGQQASGDDGADTVHRLQPDADGIATGSPPRARARAAAACAASSDVTSRQFSDTRQTWHLGSRVTSTRPTALSSARPGF